jgi:hypothetical protein
MIVVPAASQARPRSLWVSLVRAGYGAALICGPGQLIQARTGTVPSCRACTVCRVLGARHLVQAAVSAAIPLRWMIRAGAWADLLHATSMAALAADDPALRPALLADSAVAGAFAASGGALSRR